MENSGSKSVSMIRFVLAFLAVKVVAMAGSMLYSLATDATISVPATVVTIVAASIAMAWYAKAENRPMSPSEIFRFSAGNTLCDVGLSVVWGIWTLWIFGLPFSWEGLGALLGLNAHDAQNVFAAGLVMGGVAVFAISAVLAWSMSRKLPKRAEPGR